MKIRVQTLLDYVGFAVLIPVMCIGMFTGTGLKAAGAASTRPFIIDYQNHLNKHFKKILRSSTRFIIIHTSEAGLESTLRTLSRGKRVGRYRTIGGHAHYTIARNGQVYRILQHRYRADHAGLSMWNGLEDISSYSLGIELVGYHYGTITPQQYRSLSRLLEILQRVYGIADKNVLTHSQVSYGRPNTWFKRPHRGRKRCALNFEREKAGLKDSWTYDPDVRAGRLARDRHIYAMFYQHHGKRPTQEVTAAPTPAATGLPEKTSPLPNLTNIISRYNTAWNIAGEDFDDPSTLYILPGGQAVRGDQVEKELGWNRIPNGTKVLLNQPKDVEKERGPIFLVNKEYTAWSFAGPDYSKPSTFYFLPNGGIKNGSQLADWDSIPGGTRMIMGYNGPYAIQNLKGKTPWGIAGKAYNHTDTIYFIPPKTISTGDRIKDFSDLPYGSKVFLKMTN
jgi:N-acetylmuramoyl-L-alanine amidase